MKYKGNLINMTMTILSCTILILTISSPIMNSENNRDFHTIWGYANYDDAGNPPAENANVDVVCPSESEVYTTTVDEYGYWDVVVTPAWPEGSEFTVYVNGTGSYDEWTGEKNDTVSDPPDTNVGTIMVNPPPQTFELTTDSTVGGSVTDPGEGTYTYNAGAVVDLVATSDADYSFVEWTGDIGSIADPSSASTTIMMNGNYAVTAVFTNGDEFEIVNQSVFDRGFPIRYAIDGDWAAAQSFDFSSANTFTKAEIYLRKFGTPSFDLTVELRQREDPDQHPGNATLIDTVTFTPAEVPTVWEWFTVDFTDITIDPTTEYFIVCPPAPSGVTNSFGYEWGYAFNNQYDDGAFWFTRDSGNLWRSLPDMYEFSFKLYGMT